MCMCDDSTEPDVFRSEIRRARKAHRCDECRRVIPAGSRYRYVSGLWDGRWDDFAFCLRCERVRAAHRAAEKSLGEAHCDPPLGNLLEAVRECANYERERYLPAFRKAWKELAAA